MVLAYGSLARNFGINLLKLYKDCKNNILLHNPFTNDMLKQKHSYENDSHSPDRSGNPFVAGFATKD
jgi:hypothetical protein